MNPGILQPEKQSFLTLLRDINPADLCAECKIIRSARSRHCAICNQCVERFDHHCPWINNCVGIKNHNVFILFLLTIWLKIVFHSYVVAVSFFKFIYKEDQYNCLEVQCRIFCVFSWCENPYIHLLACILTALICLFYMLMSSAMLITHTLNYLSNRTTNERFSRRKTVNESGESTVMTDSIMTLSDFNMS